MSMFQYEQNVRTFQQVGFWFVLVHKILSDISICIIHTLYYKLIINIMCTKSHVVFNKKKEKSVRIDDIVFTKVGTPNLIKSGIMIFAFNFNTRYFNSFYLRCCNPSFCYCLTNCKLKLQLVILEETVSMYTVTLAVPKNTRFFVFHFQEISRTFRQTSRTLPSKA